MAKRFFAQHNIPYDERDVTQNERFMQELKARAGRFITPTLWIDGDIVIGFGRNNVSPVPGRFVKERHLRMTLFFIARSMVDVGTAARRFD
ncbi:MAG: hypothetical protein Fur0018_14620 [Anaerolineales bacterium]